MKTTLVLALVLSMSCAYAAEPFPAKPQMSRFAEQARPLLAKVQAAISAVKQMPYNSLPSAVPELFRINSELATLYFSGNKILEGIPGGANRHQSADEITFICSYSAITSLKIVLPSLISNMSHQEDRTGVYERATAASIANIEDQLSPTKNKKCNSFFETLPG